MPSSSFSPMSRVSRKPDTWNRMIVYGDPRTRATVSDALAGLSKIQGDDRLIAEGMLEQALADAGYDRSEDAPAHLPLDFKTPEGFAFYDLHPEQYRRVARHWIAEKKPRGPVIVIG